MRIISFLVLAALILVSCKSENDQTSEATDDGYIRISELQFQESKMELGHIEEKTFSSEIRTPGRIDVPPDNKVIISAVMGGYIKHTPLLAGDEVKSGDFLVSLENPEYIQIQQEYLETFRSLSYLRDDYQRQQQLLDEQVSSRKKFLKAESDYLTAEARLKGLAEKLRMLGIDAKRVQEGNILSQSSIRSPIDGTVTRVMVTRGAFVEDSSPIMEIVNNEHVHLELAVLERDIGKVSAGQTILFSIPEVADSLFVGSVKLVGAVVDPSTRTVLVHGHMDEDVQKKFVAGMFVDASILTAEEVHPSLPEPALVEREGSFIGLRLVERKEDELVFEQVALKAIDRKDGYWKLAASTEYSSQQEFLTKGTFLLLGE